MIPFYLQYQKDAFSQNGEDGLCREIFKRIGMPKMVSEWGINDAKFCSNTRVWVENGAKGIWIEYDQDLYQRAKENSEELNVDLYCSAIDQYNVNDFVPQEVDMVSIDTDGTNDYNTWKAMRAQPAVVIIEINSSYSPMDDRIEEGANYSVMLKLGLALGYFLVCHTGNLIFVDKKHRALFPEITGNGLDNYEQYFLNSWLS